jgi:hypothetical protein
MEVLNALITKADRRAALTPLPANVIKYRASVYVDDLIVFLAPAPRDFTCIRHILELFVGASGLSTNLEKCAITPIRCSVEEIVAVQEVFPCRLQDFLAKYLGAPLSLSRQSRNVEQGLIDVVAARIPTWKASLLTTAGRAMLTRTTLSVILVHVSIFPPRQSRKSIKGGALLFGREQTLSPAANARSFGPSSACQRRLADWGCRTSVFSASPYAYGGSGCAERSQTAPRLPCLPRPREKWTTCLGRRSLSWWRRRLCALLDRLMAFGWSHLQL